MNISLYYIEGISRIDTPLFDNINRQEEYMLNHKIKDIETSFYPPHYLNLIKFDTDDIDMNTTCNYLSLNYNGKEYYYFIDDIEYVSDSVIRLSVTMDVIQTYMFNINIASGIIERKFINRWIGNEINRNYMRENVSDGLFQLDSFRYYPLELSNCYTVAKFAKVSEDGQGYVKQVCSFANIETIYPSFMFFCPYENTKIRQDNGEDSYFELTTDITENMYDVGSNENSIEYYIVPKDSIVIRGNYVDTDGIMHFYKPSISHVDVLIGGISTTKGVCTIESIPTNLSYNFNFLKSTTIDNPFHPAFITQLLDENYNRIYFGSYSINTTFPLFMLLTPKVYCHMIYDILNSARIFMINDDDSFDDNYKTTVVDSNLGKLDVLNDSYAQYQASNKYRWFQAIGQTAITAAKAYLTVKTFGAFAAADVSANAALGIKKSGEMTKKSLEKISAIKSAQSKLEAREGIGALTSGSMGMLGQGISEGNAKYAPDSIKQTGTLSDLFSKTLGYYVSFERVNDYHQCAQYFHRNGFLVNEYVSSIKNIFLYVNNRHYFNIVKCKNLEVHLSDVIEDENTCENIKQRFDIGIRLWNVKYSNVTIGDFQYDNIENDFVQ